MAPAPCSAWASRSAASQAGSPLLVGHDQHLARARLAVDGDLTHHLPLGLGHVGVAGADDHVAARHPPRAVDHGGHGLGAAYRKGLGDPSRAQAAPRPAAAPAVRAAASRRRYAPPRPPARERRHQHRGRVSARPPGTYRPATASGTTCWPTTCPARRPDATGRRSRVGGSAQVGRRQRQGPARLSRMAASASRMA